MNHEPKTLVISERDDRTQKASVPDRRIARYVAFLTDNGFTVKDMIPLFWSESLGRYVTIPEA